MQLVLGVEHAWDADGVTPRWCRQRPRGARHRAEAWMIQGEWRMVPLVGRPGKQIAAGAWLSLFGRLTVLTLLAVE
eukprot:1161166-Pelagomonas_calceolata.AAC.3